MPLRPVPLWTTEYVDDPNTPLAVFVFRYRSMSALKAACIIPRTPTPVPLEERPIDELTEDELRVLVRRQRVCWCPDGLWFFYDIGRSGKRKSNKNAVSNESVRKRAPRLSVTIMMKSKLWTSARQSFERSLTQLTLPRATMMKKKKKVMMIKSKSIAFTDLRPACLSALRGVVPLL